MITINDFLVSTGMTKFNAFVALLVESREAVEKEIEERKEKFEAELISIEKRMTQDLDRRRSGGKSDGDRLDQVCIQIGNNFSYLNVLF